MMRHVSISDSLKNERRYGASYATRTEAASDRAPTELDRTTGLAEHDSMRTAGWKTETVGHLTADKLASHIQAQQGEPMRNTRQPIGTRSLALAACLICALGVAQAEDAPGPAGVSSTQLVAFTQKLQAAVTARQPAAVADLVSFPLRVNQEQRKPRSVSRAQFVASYNTLFTPHMTAVVVAQDPHALFQNSSGAMFGNGEVWLAEVCSDPACTHSKVLVTAINLPAR